MKKMKSNYNKLSSNYIILYNFCYFASIKIMMEAQISGRNFDQINIV